MRENDQKANATYTYTYVNGNITSKNYYAYTTGELGAVQDTETWTYGNSEWADLLTKWGDKNITYDAIGNPIVFDDLTMTWQGRQLETLSMGGITFAYDYNADGQRISKTFTDSESGDTYTTEYFYNGSILAGEKTGNNTIVYMYDNNGDLFGFTYNGTEYYYVKNAQNDVTAVADSQGNVLVRYYYNAWGSIIDTVDMSSNGIGDINPIRYRSYYYDADTSLYYLNSRYYLAEMCRFLNVDTEEVISTSLRTFANKNLFAYCDNNPTVRTDVTGAVWESIFDIVSLGVSVAEVAINPADPWAWASLVGDTLDLIPFVTGVGEVTRAIKTVDKVADTVQIAKAVDFTEEAADIIKTLDRSSGFTKSTATAGRKIHQGYKVGDGFNPTFKESRRIKGIRPDYIDFDNNIIYELKPMNLRSVRSGIRQLQKYNKLFGGGFTLRLELY